MKSNPPLPKNAVSTGSPAVALFLFLFAVYLLTYTPRINASDGLAMFATAESLVRRGALDIEQIRWMDLQQGTFGLDGLLYSRKGIGVPVGLLPLTWLGLIVPWFGPVSTSLLFNALVTALTAVLLLAYLELLGFSRRTGLIVALTFSLSTLAWPYAKSLFSDPFSGLLLLAAAYFLRKMQGSRGAEEQRSYEENSFPPAPPPRRTPASPPPRPPAGRIVTVVTQILPLRYPLLAGLCLGWNVATRYAEALFLPVFGLLLLTYLHQSSSLRSYNGKFAPTRESISRQDAKTPRFLILFFPLRLCALARDLSFGWGLAVLRFTSHVLRTHARPLIAFLTPILLIGLGLISFNLSRYGDPLNTGYLPNETFSGILWQGLVGQLLSPGRGLLLYCPIFLLSFFGVWPLLRRAQAETLLALSVILIHLLLYGKWFMWHGGYAWGPRFMVPTLPFWAILLAPLAARAFPDNYQPAGQALPFQNPANGTQAKSKIQNPLTPIYLSLALLGLIPQLLSVTIDFAPFQNSLLDGGRPLFDPQTFFAWRYSPFVSAWAFIQMSSLDLAWFWQGRFHGWLLLVLLANLTITGLGLVQHLRPTISAKKSPPSIPPKGGEVGWVSLPRLPAPLPLLSTALAVIFLLTTAHSLPATPLRQAVSSLNAAVRPGDAIITNDPEATMPFAELYTGRAPVLGLNNGGFPLPAAVTSRLAETLARHRQIWWLPNWLPPEQSAIEQTLLAEGFKAREENFDGQRLLLFALPGALPRRPVEATFDGRLHLLSVAKPPQVSPGSALPVELTWQALALIGQDYHVFVHLVSEAGEVVAQADGQPANWQRPTSTWAVEELITDRHGLWLPPQIAPGRYELRLGLYDPASGARLLLPAGEDAVQVEVGVE